MEQAVLAAASSPHVIPTVMGQTAAAERAVAQRVRVEPVGALLVELVARAVARRVHHIPAAHPHPRTAPQAAAHTRARVAARTTAARRAWESSLWTGTALHPDV